MEAGRYEVGTECIHLHQRGELGGIAVVIGEETLRQRRAGRGLDGDQLDVAPAAQLLAQEGEGDAGEVAAAAGAADDHVRVVAGHLQLLLCLETRDRLVQQDMIQHAAERVFGVVALGGQLDGLADGDAETAGAVGMLREDGTPGRGRVARAGDALCPEGLHEGASIRLVVEAHLDHVDDDLEAEHGPGQGERRAPLTGTGLGGDPLHAFLFVVEGLRDGGIGLMTAGRAHALVLVVDLRRRLERFLQSTCPVEWRGAPLPIDLAYRLGDLDLALAAHLLLDHGTREDHRQIVRRNGLLGARMQDRIERRRKIGVDVVPSAREMLLVEQIFH